MGRIGPRRQRFEVLPEPAWTLADIVGPPLADPALSDPDDAPASRVEASAPAGRPDAVRRAG